ncbi:MAG TPA: type VI secretion system protein [Candidatus Angelobacter sp.]|jgi:type VI secretion system protein ImpL
MILTLLLAGKSLGELALPAVIAAFVLVGVFLWSRSGSAMLSLGKLRPGPCFLLLGPADSGKTALMNDLPHVFSAQDSTWIDDVNAGVALWHCAGAEILEVAGDLFVPAPNGNGADEEWKSFLTQLQRRRPRRPVDGIILTLPYTQLAGERALTEEILKRHATQASSQLKLLRDKFGFCLPVYVVITKCDAIPGYSTFVESQLMPHLGEIFGWSNPYNLNASFDPQWARQALVEANRVLSGQRALFFARRNSATAYADSTLQDELFLFPVCLKKLQARLTLYLGQFFQESGHRDGLQFRGIYFSGSATQSSEAFEEIRDKSNEAHGARFTRDLFEQKIFLERGLSRPVETAFTQRSAEVALARGLCGVAALLLFPGALLGWYNLNKNAKKIQPHLQQIQTGLGQAKDGANPVSAYAAIYAAQGLSGRNFQSVFLPASMLDSLNNQLQQVMPPVFTRLVYPGLLAELEHRTGDLLRDPAQPARDQKITPASGAGPNAGQRLQNFTDALLTLQGNIVRFNSLAPAGRGQGRVMMVLANSLSPQTFADLTKRDTAAMNDIVRASSGALFDGRPWNGPTLAVLEARVTDVLRQSMNEEQLLSSLDSLVSKIDQLEKNKLDTYDQLNGLLQSLDQVQALLATPDLQWIANSEDPFQLPDALTKPLDRIFSQPAKENILLCDATRAENSCPGQQQLKFFIEQMARTHFADMRKRLLVYKSQTTGPLLATTEAKLQLSPDAADLQTVLANFMKLPFVAHEGTGRLRDVEGGQQLFWDNDRLQAALQDKEAYDKFFGSQLAGTSANLQDTFEEVALSRLEANMVDSVASAQQFQPLASGDTADQATINEARSFQAVSPSLKQLLEQFSELDFDDDYQDLLRVSTGHVLMMLTRLDRAFDAGHFYWPSTGNFDAWTGNSLPSVASYGAHNSEDMAGYLVAQRQAVQRYASAAQPLVAYLQQNAGKAQKQAALVAKWQSIINDMEKYDSAGVASGLGSVEDFLINSMDKTVPPDCQISAAPAASRLVYFVQVRHSLERALTARCRSLQSQAAVQQYARITDFFNQRLAGKFPFSADATAQDADPADVVELFHQLDVDGKSIRQGLQNPASAKIRTFLSQLEALRPLFASLLSGEPGAPLALDMTPVFRVNRNHEMNGNQIMDWSLQVGGSVFRSADPPSTGRWTFGEPVKLVLRWAKDSPQQPVAVAPAIAVPETRTIIFEYQDSWSLLKMLVQHAAASSDLDRSVDSDPQTLVFIVGQESSGVSGKSQGAETPQKETSTGQIAKVFIRVKIYPPGKPDALRVPVFPTPAPAP